MPIYAFQCAECGHSFDRLQKLSDADPDTCPSCGATGGVRRQLTAPAFRLSGSGWYETDFKKDGDKKRNLAGGDDAPKSETKDVKDAKPADGKSDAAPAKKESAKSEPAAAATAAPAKTKSETPSSG